MQMHGRPAREQLNIFSIIFLLPLPRSFLCLLSFTEGRNLGDINDGVNCGSQWCYTHPGGRGRRREKLKEPSTSGAQCFRQVWGGGGGE